MLTSVRARCRPAIIKKKCRQLEMNGTGGMSRNIGLLSARHQTASSMQQSSNSAFMALDIFEVGRFRRPSNFDSIKVEQIRESTDARYRC